MKTKNYPPNDNTRSATTQKKEQCQWCKAKSPLSDQYTVVNDLDANNGAGEVIKKKVGKRKLPAKQSHWCPDCAEKRVKMSQRWLDRRAGIEAKPKKAAAKKVAKKAAKPAKPAAKKKPAARKAKKAKRGSTATKADLAAEAAKVSEEAPF